MQQGIASVLQKTTHMKHFQKLIQQRITSKSFEILKHRKAESQKPMVLKTGTKKELEKKLITGFLVGPDGRTGDVINNLIKILK